MVSTELFVTRGWRMPRYADFQRNQINGKHDDASLKLTIEEEKDKTKDKLSANQK